ncbi:YibE/F family protein, partial [Candidatus Roizmanbacteria bacterium]|nr:YibE/F family protein [Candidatus Roizmanbacteria bacterium]
MRNIASVFIVVLFLAIGLFSTVSAQSLQNQNLEETLEAKITRIIQEKEVSVEGKKQTEQTLELLITRGSIKGQKITLENGDVAVSNSVRYIVGDEVIVNYSKGTNGRGTYITDYIRRLPIYILSVVFVGLVVLIGRWKGAASLISLAISFFFIMSMIIPQISQGVSPIVIVMLASIFIIPITFYLSHGVNKKTTVAIIGTFLSLVISGVLIIWFSQLMKLSGFISDEASFLQVMKGNINMKDLLLAGMMIGTLGAINDITISQSAVIFQLQQTDPKLGWRELYKRAMNVGQDHIGSMVNTLVLVYAGASLPLFLLFSDNPKPFGQVINYEIIAVEILRTLIGSIALILAVPFTSLLA